MKTVNDLGIKEFECKQLDEKVEQGTSLLEALRKENEAKKNQVSSL